MSEAKSTKSGRNKAYCAAYKLSNSAKFNKAKRIATHLSTPGKDHIAVTALQLICKADTKSSKAFSGINRIDPSRYDQQMRMFVKRAAKALRQLAKAEHELKLAEDAKDAKAAALAHAACLKAQRYAQHYSR